MNVALRILLSILLANYGSHAGFAQDGVGDSPIDGARLKQADSLDWKPTASWKAEPLGAGESGRRLVVLVSADEGHRAEAVALQGLLEAESFAGWHGEILERGQLDIILREQRLTANWSEANAIKFGQVVHVDFLLMVGIEANRVRCRVNQFPSTTVVVEFDLPNKAEDRVAKQIGLRAFRAMAERFRDPSRVSVAIGSFLVEDPFSKYTDLDRSLHAALRKRLLTFQRIDLAERFHPTQLLREFELARAGFVPSVMAQLTAPVSDVLIVGDIEPTANQDLDKQDIELAYRIRIVSPTGLFEAFDVKFVLPKNDSSRAADQIADAVQTALTRLPLTLSRKADSDGLAIEFQALKQRAFKLLPSPTKEDGNFFSNGSYKGSWQTGTPAVIERAMRAVENALLLKGDDTQMLVCAVPLLFELAAAETPHRRLERPSLRQQALLELSCDYIEMALALNYDENSRGIAYDTLRREDYWFCVPDRQRPMIARMARGGTADGWFPHQAEYARIWLIEMATDMPARIEQFRLARREGGEKFDSLFRLLDGLPRFYLKQRNAKLDADKLRQMAAQLRGVADELAGESSPMSQGMAKYIRVFIGFYSEPRDPKWEAELTEAIDLIPAIFREPGPKLPKDDYSNGIYHFVRWNNEPSNEASRKLLRRFLTRQVEIQNYQDHQVTDAISRLLPLLTGESERADGLQLLTSLLEHDNTGGAADYDRMRLARWRNDFLQTQTSSRLSRDRLVEVNLDSAMGQTRVKKILFAFDRIWALRCDYYLQDQLGEIFTVEPTSTRATRLKGLSARITDIASSKDQLAVASIDNGLALVSPTGDLARQIRPDNSPLPTLMVRTVASDGSRFILGLPGVDAGTGYSSYFLYDLDPRAGTLKKTTTRLDYHAYYQSRFDTTANRFAFQTFDERFHETDEQRWTFRRAPVRGPIHRVTVTDSGKTTIFTYTGFELNFVYDFVHWQDQLIFATGNGLYAARPGTDQLTCVLSELDLEFSSLCPVGDTLFVGTNRGLHRLDAKVFAASAR